MGLDMYAYSAARAGQDDEYWANCSLPEGGVLGQDEVSSCSKPKELAYWRKHPNLHGWFRREWESQGNEGDFNGDELEIDWAMLERLEYDVINGELPGTSGFFFGEGSDDYYREQDLEFIKNARAELFMGLKVFYNSSW